MACERSDSEDFDVKVLEFPWNYPWLLSDMTERKEFAYKERKISIGIFLIH